MSFHVQKQGQWEKNKLVEETRQQAMPTEKVTAILLQNFDENTNTELQNTENGSKKKTKTKQNKTKKGLIV